MINIRYELSLTRNYVSDWSINDAIREILQNAIDSETDGHVMDINYKNDTLTISNDGAELLPSNLLLGGDNKTENSRMIGGFSEGFKIALVVLLRNAIKVKIKNNGTLWLPKFEKSDLYNSEILVIDSYEDNSTDGFLEFELYPLNFNRYNDLLKDFPIITNDFGEVEETDYGKILFDKKFKGRIFVNGLYVQTDDNFEFGYDFKPEYVELDRDRKSN